MSVVQAGLRFLETLTPVLKNSKFKETGVLTPEEFVAAGDFLVYKCPTWAWASGEKSKERNYLPPDKQYLVTKNVPCYKRVKEMEYNEVESNVASGDGDDWVATHDENQGDRDTEITEIVADMSLKDKKKAKAPVVEDDDDEIPDIDDVDFNDNLVEESDPATLEEEADDDGEDHILKTRTYDLSITYDKYYQTPRVWLFGYDEHRNPLKPAQIYQDISQDHANKTVTIEPHPHLNVSQASIHPCKHSNVMKKIIDHLVEYGNDLRVDQYLILFLKFVSAIIPTVNYDFTINISSSD